MDNYDDVMNRLNSTKPVIDRDPFIGEGNHILSVASIETYLDKKHGKSVRATFIVDQSSCHPPGSTVCKTWNLFKPAKFETQANDADGFADFLCKLQGLPEGQHAQSARAVLKPVAEGGNAEAQPARGCRIAAQGRASGQPNPTTGKRYVQVSWQTVPQDGATIVAQRAQLDAAHPYRPRAAPAPAPQQYANQYQQAPVAQPYAQPVAQGGYVNSQPQQFAQPAPVAPAPQQGGFLAMLPNK